jgi:hypothetical protein
MVMTLKVTARAQAEVLLSVVAAAESNDAECATEERSHEFTDL